MGKKTIVSLLALNIILTAILIQLISSRSKDLALFEATLGAYQQSTCEAREDLRIPVRLQRLANDAELSE